MSEVIRILTCRDKIYEIAINPKLAHNLGVERKLKGLLGFGSRKCYVDIRTSRDVEENEIILSQDIVDYLYLPDYPDFEVCMVDQTIMIGPHLGIVMRRYDEELTKPILQDLLKYTCEYSRLHGSVIVFAQDKVDTQKRLIEGYCYNPKTDDWARGIFPYPQSIFVQSSLDRHLKDDFLSSIGDTVFNNIYLDKFMVYDYLSTDNELVNHVPHTILYKTGGDIFNMLNLHGKVYVKPRAGTKGIGVVRISLEGGRIAFRYREANNNMEKFFDRPAECREYIEQLFTPNSYVIQQSVEVLTYEGRVTDFRLMIQKDSKGSYVCKGITARIGAPGSVVSNVYSGGDSVWGRDLLKKMLNFSEQETFSMLESMKSFGLRICSALAEMGVQYGDLGFDIGIDKNLKLWLIEINSLCPDPKAAMTVNDIELYKDLLSTPLFYAKFLSGFKD